MTPRIRNNALVGARHAVPVLPWCVDKYGSSRLSLPPAIALPSARLKRLKRREPPEFPPAQAPRAQCPPATQTHQDGGCTRRGRQ
jgi:hypothetical protein